MALAPCAARSQTRADMPIYRMPARRNPARPPPALPNRPDRAALHDAALRHLARYATTAAGLLRVLARRIDRWARATAAESDAVAATLDLARQEVAALVAAGLLDDAAFAASRARSLVRAGRSRRAVAAHLAQRGVDADVVQAAMPEDAGAELGAALLLARKRRIGPFAVVAMDAPARLRALGMLARAGFSQDTARQALAMARGEAEDRIIQLRRD